MTTSINQNKHIVILHLGSHLVAEHIESILIEKLAAVRYRDAYHIELPQGEAWLFDYGVLVGWDVNENDRQQLVYNLSPVIAEAVNRPLLDRYGYKFSSDPKLVELTIKHDFIELPNEDLLTRLALSHAFAQSCKLEFFEDQAQVMISENSYIAKQLADTGKVPLNRTELAKLRGALFATSSDITLHFNLLDTPEFFWDYPALEGTYLKLARYLDLSSRIDILNKKLMTIQNLLDVLSTEQNHKHSALLEWFIIILIMIDIVIYFIPH